MKLDSNRTRIESAKNETNKIEMKSIFEFIRKFDSMFIVGPRWGAFES